MTSPTTLSTASGRAWIEIDHGALAHNLGVLRALAGPAKQVVAVIKANGYGHGDVELARTLAAAGAERLAVATIDEARRVRAAVGDRPIVLLWPVGPDVFAELFDLDLEPVVDRVEVVEQLAHLAADRERPLGVHLKVDTGLRRLGASAEDALAVGSAIAGAKGLWMAGTMTHLAAVEDQAFTDVQLTTFSRVLDGLAGLGIDPGITHVAATAAVLAGVGNFADAIRPGLGLYGLVPDGLADTAATGGDRLRPVLSLRTHAVRLARVPAGTPVGYGLRWRAPHDAWLATLPIGYGDGWPRIHANNGHALVRGVRVPMVGAISMDGLVVDVSEVGPRAGDEEFVLIGRQGNDEISVAEIARQRRTISYEVTTALGARLERRHMSGGGAG